MSETFGARPTGGALAIGMALGVLLALVSPYLLVLLPVLFAAPVLCARLYAYAGMWPVAVSAAGQLIAAHLSFGAVGAGMVFIGLIVPMTLVLRLVSRGRPLAETLRIAIPVWILSALAAFLLAHQSAGMSIADYVARELEMQFGALPKGMSDTILSTMTNTPLPRDINLQMLRVDFLETGFLAADARAQLLPAALAAVRNGIAMLLPGALISSSALTALLSVAWPSRVLVRESQLPGRAWLPLSAWHLPPGMTFGLIGLYIVSMIVVSTAEGGDMDAVYMAATMIAGLAFRVQAAGSAERRLGKLGVRLGGRAALIAAFVLLPYFSNISFYYGMFSALSGPTYGAIPQMIKRWRGGGGDG